MNPIGQEQADSRAGRPRDIMQPEEGTLERSGRPRPLILAIPYPTSNVAANTREAEKGRGLEAVGSLGQELREKP